MTKTIGKTTPTFNPEQYSQLLTEVLPKVIETETEYEQILAKAEQLTFTPNKTTEQQSLLKLLVLLIEQYESEHYPLNTPKPYEILQHLIESSGTCQADLVGIIGTTEVVSEVVSGKRSISKVQAKALGEYFKVLPSLFV